MTNSHNVPAADNSGRDQVHGNNNSPAPIASSEKHNNTTVNILIVIICVVAVIAGLAIFQPWNSSGKNSQTGESSASATSSMNASADVSHSDSTYDNKESDIARQKNWQANRDFISSVGQKQRDLITSINKQPPEPGQSLGPNNAPVVVHVFADFSCPMCTKLHQSVFRDLTEMANRGTIQLRWHNFVIFERFGSDKAARGARAAAQQGKMWSFIDAAYTSAEEGDHTAYTDESVKALAVQAGVPNMDTFRTDYASTRIVDAVKAETQYAQQLGLTGTPALLINNALITGALPHDVILHTVEVQKDLVSAQK